jgi:class 3 adenylate cyclase
MNILLHKLIDSIRQSLGLVQGSGAYPATSVMVSGYSLDSDCGETNCAQAGPGGKPTGVLYADIADYTRLAEKNEEATQLRLVEAIRIMMTNVAANEGHITHLDGDAVLAEFKDADSALHCAINVQRAAWQWNANLPMDQQVFFRIGVNFGDLVSGQDDIRGNEAKLNERLEKLASSAGICVSDSVRQELDNRPGFKFFDMGKRYVRDVSEPVHAYWIEVDPREGVEPGSTSAVKISAIPS